MKKTIFLLVLLTVCTNHAAYAAETGTANNTKTTDYLSWYLGVGVNIDFANDAQVKGASAGSIDYKNSFSFPDIFIGYRPEALYNNSGDVRFEAELLGHGFGIDALKGENASTGKKGYLMTGALMANVYYDIHTPTSFTPFVGAGIGIAKTSFSKNPGYGITDKDSSDVTLAYQFKAGVSYMPSGWTNTSFSLSYAYFNAGCPEFDAGNGKEKIDDVSSNGLELSVTYAF